MASITNDAKRDAQRLLSQYATTPKDCAALFDAMARYLFEFRQAHADTCSDRIAWANLIGSLDCGVRIVREEGH